MTVAQPRQILHVLGRMARGGVETWLMNLLRHVDRSRFQFTFCVLFETPGDFDDEIRSLGCRVVVCNVRQSRRAFAKQFVGLLRELAPDVLHSHGLFSTGYLAKLAAQARVPTRIAHLHSTRDGHPNTLGRRAYRWLMRRYIWKYCTHAIGCSSAAADYVLSPGWRRHSRFTVLPCGIDTSIFGQPHDRVALGAALDVPPDRMVIGHVGSFREVKNHAFMVRVMQALLRKDAKVHMVFVGDGPLRAEIQAQVQAAGQAEHFTFAGLRGDVPVLMENVFDLFLMPSFYEGLPVVTTEAQCAGLPCLLSDVITREATVINDLVHWQALDAGAEVWADQVLEILRQPHYDPQEALVAVRQSPFNIETGVRLLCELYST